MFTGSAYWCLCTRTKEHFSPTRQRTALPTGVYFISVQCKSAL